MLSIQCLIKGGHKCIQITNVCIYLCSSHTYVRSQATQPPHHVPWIYALLTIFPFFVTCCSDSMHPFKNDASGNIKIYWQRTPESFVVTHNFKVGKFHIVFTGIIVHVRRHINISCSKSKNMCVLVFSQHCDIRTISAIQYDKSIYPYILLATCCTWTSFGLLTKLIFWIPCTPLWCMCTLFCCSQIYLETVGG